MSVTSDDEAIPIEIATARFVYVNAPRDDKIAD